MLLRPQIPKAMRQRSATLFRGISTASESSRHKKSSSWTNSLSFASPESDFVSFPEMTMSRISSVTSGPTWSKTLSFASPESDFVSASKFKHTAEDSATESNEDTWSKSLSFASPESDFVSAPKMVHMSTTLEKKEWSESLAYASPESDFVSASKSMHLAHSASSDSRHNVDSLLEEIFENQNLFSSPHTATGFIPYIEMIDEKFLETVLQRHYLKENLPKTIEDALKDKRPIVVTTAESPFSIVDVNDAWESLCGYRREEAIGRNLGELLQGTDTDVASANNLIRTLQETGFSETVLTNYAKNGRQFTNHIQVGMIPSGDDSGTYSSNNSYFVGVLHDISANSNQKAAAM